MKASHRRALRRAVTYRRCPNCNAMRLHVVSCAPITLGCRRCGSHYYDHFVSLPTVAGTRTVALIRPPREGEGTQ